MKLPRSRGFTLIEVLAAFAMLALSLGALYEAFGGALRRGAAATQRELASLRAQSLLDEYRGSGGLLPAQRQGRDGDTGFEWRIASKPYPAEILPDARWVTDTVLIEVRWGEGASQKLQRESVELTRRGKA